MKLSDHNSIADEANDLDRRVKRFDDQIKVLVSRRNDMTVLSKCIREMRHDDSEFYKEIDREVMRIVDSMSHDVFRTIEMKFAAEARELRIEANIKKQQISNFFKDNEVT